jgi:hypothetical protein
MSLDMGNLTDADSERMLAFLRQLARMDTYQEESQDCLDAGTTDGDIAWNWAVETARDILNRKAK